MPVHQTGLVVLAVDDIVPSQGVVQVRAVLISFQYSFRSVRRIDVKRTVVRFPQLGETVIVRLILGAVEGLCG